MGVFGPWEDYLRSEKASGVEESEVHSLAELHVFGGFLLAVHFIFNTLNHPPNDRTGFWGFGVLGFQYFVLCVFYSLFVF